MRSRDAGTARFLLAVEPSRRAGQKAKPAWTLPVACGAGDAPASPASASSNALLQMPIELTLDTLRGPHRPLIVWALFWGARPFSELMRHVPHVTKKALRRELADLEGLGLVSRDVRPGSSRHAEYSLTSLGQTLRPVVGVMYEWGLLRLGLERRPIGRLAREGEILS
jgi:DNA-binding HxlR family transcriptional regulator